MRRTTIALFLAIACPALCQGQDDTSAFLKVEKSYQKSLYQAHRPVLESYLRKLRKHRTSAKSKGLNALVKEIDSEIKALEDQLKKEAAALKKELKDVAPIDRR